MVADVGRPSGGAEPAGRRRGRLPVTGAGTYCSTVAGVDGAGNVDPLGSGQRCVAYVPVGEMRR
jgi:hypothetical protein